MKTILVVFVNSKVLNTKTLRGMKKYSFNTNDVLKEGDMIETESYSTKLQVVKVLEESYKYYNSATGDLSNTFTSTAQNEIVELVLREDNTEVIYGKVITE